mmetsp:Transcript_49887/g.117283  ORF Transcript_49887/g.117283 Transcript_49887/m.117283 type:complete len:214 (+) Transcript_49887:500-1141(+)
MCCTSSRTLALLVTTNQRLSMSTGFSLLPPRVLQTSLLRSWLRARRTLCGRSTRTTPRIDLMRQQRPASSSAPSCGVACKSTTGFRRRRGVRLAGCGGLAMSTETSSSSKLPKTRPTPTGRRSCEGRVSVGRLLTPTCCTLCLWESTRARYLAMAQTACWATKTNSSASSPWRLASQWICLTSLLSRPLPSSCTLHRCTLHTLQHTPPTHSTL